MSKFFVLIVALAAIGTILKFTFNVEGTKFEKIAYVSHTMKRALTYRKPSGYPARHRYVRYA